MIWLGPLPTHPPLNDQADYCRRRCFSFFFSFDCTPNTPVTRSWSVGKMRRTLFLILRSRLKCRTVTRLKKKASFVTVIHRFHRRGGDFERERVEFQKEFLAREARCNIIGHVDSIKHSGRSLILSWADASSRNPSTGFTRGFPLLCVFSGRAVGFSVAYVCKIRTIAAIRAARGGGRIWCDFFYIITNNEH